MNLNNIKNLKLLNNQLILNESFKKLFSKEFFEFLIILHREFEDQRQELLKERIKIQSSIISNNSNKTININKPNETFEIRNNPNWKIRDIPEQLKDRKCDLVCLDVTDYETLKRCVLSGANGVQVDFDDGYSPSWLNGLMAQKNIYDIVRDPSLNTPECSLLLVRPRSLNLDEMHILIDGKPLSGTLFDIAMFLYHNNQLLIEKGRGPYFYIPKIENYKEAIWWNSVLSRCEQLLSIKPFTCKAIVLIENILATFQMEEIIYYLCDYIVALNTGRWDYIFSYIKKFSEFPQYNLPNKLKLGLNQDFLSSYYKLLVMVSHRRGCLATGGMAPQYPSNPNASLNDKELLSVFNGKRDEASMGLDGALVAHFSAVKSCRDAFKEIIGNTHLNHLTNYRQFNYSPLESTKYYSQLLSTCSNLNDKSIANISINDVNSCLKVLYLYIFHWIYKFKGAVNIDGVVEDLATSEINRVLLWKWLKFGVEIKEENNNPLTIDIIFNQLFLLKNLFNNLISNDQHLQICKIILIFLQSNQLIDFMPTILYPFILNLNLLSKQ